MLLYEVEEIVKTLEQDMLTATKNSLFIKASMPVNFTGLLLRAWNEFDCTEIEGSDVIQYADYYIYITDITNFTNFLLQLSYCTKEVFRTHDVKVVFTVNALKVVNNQAWIHFKPKEV